MFFTHSEISFNASVDLTGNAPSDQENDTGLALSSDFEEDDLFASKGRSEEDAEQSESVTQSSSRIGRGTGSRMSVSEKTQL
ncbi:hypothetical protein KEM56_002876, partial [Ascosphaera pollenicola]